MFQPLSGTVTVTQLASGTEQAGGDPVVLQVGDDGAFSVSVPPGRYSLVGASPSVGGVGCTGGPVLVSAGRSVSVDVECPLP